jgi:flagellar biosynthesis protein FlhF
MKIKTYLAKDMRTALSLVRDEQGPDAVILSTRSVPGGVEVAAAVDMEAVKEAMQPAPKPPAVVREVAAVPMPAEQPDFSLVLSRSRDVVSVAEPVAAPAPAPITATATGPAPVSSGTRRRQHRFRLRPFPGRRRRTAQLARRSRDTARPAGLERSGSSFTGGR